MSGRARLIWALVIVIAIAACVWLFLVGQLFTFMQIGIVFVPLAGLAALAYVGARTPAASIAAYILLFFVGIGVVFNSLTYILFGFVKDWTKFNLLLSNPAGVDRSTILDIFAPNTGPGLLWGLLLLFLAALLSAAMLLRPVRKAVSRIMPIDPDNFVHKIALSILTLILLTSFIPLIVLGGTPPLLTLVNGAGNSSLKSALSVGPESLVYQFIWTIPAAFIAAGWPIVRTLQAAFVRLGFVRPTLVQVLFGVGAGLGLALVAAFAIDPAIHWLWQTLGWATTDSAAFDKLLTNLVTPIGAVLIGVTAGVGEEMAVRGLLQPRVGLIASNLVFTSLHAFQYGPDALLSVFIIGLILGIIRARSNTTTYALVHGVYDFALVISSIIFVSQ
jgi:membrane protease YdiL (CAAX protease family)